MKHITYSQQDQYPLCILVGSMNQKEIKEAYLNPFGIPEDEVLVLSLFQSETAKKTSAKEIKEYIQTELQPVMDEFKVQHILCADAEYFKAFSKEKKADTKIGYVCDSVFGNQKINYVPNYMAIFYDPPKVKKKIALAVQSAISYASGTYVDPGKNIIRNARYVHSIGDIAATLLMLKHMECPFTVDIECFSLKHTTSGIGTITFCWNEHEGVAFPVDFSEDPQQVRTMLREFFIANNTTLIYHNISFDVYILVYQLFMEHILDTEGMLYGLEVMLKNFECTKIITYLATNSCAGNKLGLKEQAQEFAGDYAQEDIKDIRKIPLPELLEYNLVDGLSTWFVYLKNYPKMVADDQLDIYQNLFKPAIKDIIQMQLTGLPLYMPAVLEVEKALLGVYQDAIDRIENTKCVQEFQYYLKEKYVAKMHAKWVKKRITLDEVPEDEKFNPRSYPQLQALLYEQLGLPVLALTDTKQPSCDGDTIEKLLNHTNKLDIKELLLALQDFAAVDKIITSFIPAFKEAAQAPDGWWYLFGNFVLGGTVSGRLSSNSPNLQNLPANVVMKISDALLKKFPFLKQFMVKDKLSLGKLIKYCFQAPPGWIFCGLDFASLEDRISALTTKDPNKLKVYAGSKQFVVTINGTDHHIKEEDVVSYDGQELTGIQLYEKLTGCIPSDVSNS